MSGFDDSVKIMSLSKKGKIRLNNRENQNDPSGLLQILVKEIPEIPTK